jgi:hypothetical protein
MTMVRRFGPVALPTLLFAAAAWHTVMITASQVPSVAVPAALVVAPVAAALAWWLTPGPQVTVTDRDSDYISAFILVVLGSWIIYRAPGRLAGDFLFFRPDLIGTGLYALTLVSLLKGTRAALTIAPSVMLAAIVASPGLQLLTVGFAPTGPALGLFSGLLATLPLVVVRPRGWQVMARRLLAVAGSAALIGLATHAARLSYVGISIASGLGSLVALTVVMVRAQRGTKIRAWPAVERTRLLYGTAAGLLAALVGLNLLIPTTQVNAATVAGRSLTVPGEAEATYPTEQGLTVRSWRLPLDAPENQAAMVVTTTGPSAAAVNTYPTATLLTWAESACPNTATYHLDGIVVTASQRQDTTNGYDWDDYEWGWSTPGAYQRVALVLANAPSGEPAPLPSLVSNIRHNTAGVINQLLAGRHLECGPTRPSAHTAAGRLLRSIVGPVPHWPAGSKANR